ncbi:MAG TPA: SPFH domain-containing protein [archaeon]|nr:SPFH domain-containing protein [archaeon]
MKAENVKSLAFLAVFAVVIFALFLLIQNTSLITGNLWWIAPALAVLFLVSRYDYILQLKDYERAVIFRFGKVNRVGGPGWAVLFPPLESFEHVDLRTKVIDVPRQDIITKDNIEVNIDAVIYLKVNKDNASVINSIVEVEDYVKASQLLILSVLRDKAGSMTMAELISNVEDLNKAIKEELERVSKKWGIGVEEAAIKDINIPKTVLEAMHEQKAAVQRKLARIELAEASKAEINAIKEAAENLSDKTVAYYYIKALEKLGEGKRTKFIFPMELSRLAETISGSKASDEQLESLMKKYLPLVKELAKKGKKGK